MTYELVVISTVAAPPERVWERVATPEGVNDELRPLVRMTFPRDASLDPESLPIGRRAFRSWILLFGLVPIDYDDVTLVRLEPGRGFLERSPMLSQRVWEHERALRPVDGGCEVVDRVLFEPRLPVGGRLMTAVFRQVFRHRHRRLRRRFG